MSHAILQISAAAYADIRDRLTALDEKLNPDPSYASEYIRPAGVLGRPERLIFGPVAFEALPAEVDPLKDLLEMTGCSDAADLEDMAKVGKSLLDAIATNSKSGPLKGWAPADDPAEVVVDLLNMLEDQKPVRHVDDMNDAVLVGMALEDDAAALRAYLEEEAVTFLGADLERFPNHQGIDGVIDLVALARILRRRYLTAEKEATLLAAARWKALMGAAPRLIGAAGVEFDEGIKAKPDGYIHAGVEFWTKAGIPWIERGREGTAAAVLTLIADQIIAMGGEAWAYENGERVEVPPKSA